VRMRNAGANHSTGSETILIFVASGLFGKHDIVDDRAAKIVLTHSLTSGSCILHPIR